MSTQVRNELDRIDQNIANTYAVLDALGADMPAEQNSNNLAATAGSAKAVLYSEQSLSPDQQAQARQNIGAISEDEIPSNAIIDVTELPTENIDEKVFYRLLTGYLVTDQIVQNMYTCYCVESLPETGEPATNIDQTAGNVYYVVGEGALYGYVDSMLSMGLGVPAGWYPVATLLSALGLEYAGVITDIADCPYDGAFRFLLERVVYQYKDKWISMKTIGWTGTGASSDVFNHPINNASGACSHAEGFCTIASGTAAHAEGYSSHAEGDYSHTEGHSSHAEGDYSHAEGSSSHAEGYRSHAEGYYSHAVGSSQHVQGEYNIVDPNYDKNKPDVRAKYAHIVGNGTNAKRSNAHTLDWNGNAWYQGEVYVGGTDQDTNSHRLAKVSELPTKTSDLNNDSKFITASGAPVQSVNGKTGAVQLTASDVGARPSTWTPSAADVGAVSYNVQSLTDTQKATARANIGAASAADISVAGGSGRTVTEADLMWMEGWQAPNNANGTEDPGINLKNSHSRRMSMPPFWMAAGTVLSRNDEFYTAIDAADMDSDGYAARIMLSRYDPDSENSNPMGWVQMLYSEIASTPTITISTDGWYILSVTHGTNNAATKTFGQPYKFSYLLADGYEPNYVKCIDWKTYYNVRGAGVSQPGFSNGLNWASRREPGCPYYLDNQGFGSEYNRGGYKTSDLTLSSKSSSSVAGIMSYKDEIWTFFTSADDHSNLGSVTKYRIHENHWIEYLGRCWINAGHINSVHYDPVSDTMVWGNGSTSYTLEGEGYILNNFSSSRLANAYNDEICLMADLGVDTVSLPIATYGVKANVIGIGCDYYSGNTMSLIVALLTNDGNTLRLGHIAGTEEAKPKYLWKNCTWLDPMTIGDANETIGSGSTESYAHCVQDMTVWQGQLLWGEGHGENRYALWKYTPTESVRVSNLMQTMPNSNVHAVTEHNGKLFGSGLNMFCMIDPDAGKKMVYGKIPSEYVEDKPIVVPEDTNLWDLAERTEMTREEQGLGTGDTYNLLATATRTISYDKYIRGATSNGQWNFNPNNRPNITVDGKNFTMEVISSGLGLGMPMDLEVGKTYRISYTASAGHRLYATYFNDNGVYTTSSAIVSSDSAGGTFNKTFTVADNAYCQLTFRAGVSTVSFTDIVVELVE